MKTSRIRFVFLAATIVIAQCSPVATPAFATNTPTPTPTTSASRSIAHQSQTQSQTAQGGNAQQTQSANNAGNTQDTAVVSNYEDRLQAPAVSAPAVYASGPCNSGWSAGLSIPGGGISGGKAKADTNCDRREVARVLAPLNPSLALKVLCADPLVAAVATASDCVYADNVSARIETTEPKREDGVADAVTRDEVDTKIERAFKQSQSK